MKKNLFYLAISVVVIAFMFSIPVIDKISVSRAYSYMSAYDEEGFDRVGIIIEENESLQKVDNYSYYTFLNECAIQNNLVIYVLTSSLSNETNSYENNIYLSTNDLFLKERLLLFNGYAENLGEDVSFSIYGDSTSKILSFNYPNQTNVKSLHHYDEKGKYINLISIKGDLKENVERFLNDVSKKYGDIVVQSPYTSGKSTLMEDDKEAASELYSKINIKLSLALIITVLFCSKIFSYSKNISLYKIDGYNTFDIYAKIYLIPLIKYMIIMTLSLIILLIGIFNSNILSLLIILKIFMLEVLQMILLTLGVSIVIYYIILYTPITKSIKGENKLSEVQIIVYLTKVFAIFMIIPILASTFNNTRNLLIMWSRYEEAKASLVSYYSFGIQGASSKYERDIGTENYIALRDKLASNGNLFEQSKAFFIEDIDDFNPKVKDEYYIVDSFYLENNGLIDESCNLKKICIYLNDKSNYNLTNIDAKVRNMTREYIPYNLIKYSDKLRSYNILDLFYSNHIEDKPIIYIPVEEGLDGQLNNKILYYEGEKEQAQKYIDDIFIEFGYSPMYEISSLDSVFERQFQLYENLNIKSFIDFLILLCAYVLTNRLLIDVDIDNNRKKYIISKSEGVNPYSFLNYFAKIVSPSIIALLLNIFLNRTNILKNSFVIVTLLLIIESALYIMYKYKLNNVRRYK